MFCAWVIFINQSELVHLMAVVGPTRHSRTSMSVSMSLHGAAGPTAGGQQGGLHAAQPYYHPQHAAAPAHTQEQVQPDRPIGYGAFGVVWWVHTIDWYCQGRFYLSTIPRPKVYFGVFLCSHKREKKNVISRLLMHLLVKCMLCKI